MSRSDEFRIWQAMLRRCYELDFTAYENYGGRGVTVCDRWNPKAGGSFENFYKDMGPRPSKKHQLDKEAVLLTNKVYGPGLVKWSLPAENARNTRSVRWVVFRGEKMRLVDLADRFNLPNAKLYQMIFVNRRSPEDSVERLLAKSKMVQDCAMSNLNAA
jgi:NifB/MoaA-like Fe-S oxidoreductase